MDRGGENLDRRVHAIDIDSREKRLNELGYKQELRREMSLLKTFGITFSSMVVFIGTPLYGSSLLYAGPAPLIWGWVVVTFFTWFIGIAMAEICSSFPAIICERENEMSRKLMELLKRFREIDHSYYQLPQVVRQGEQPRESRLLLASLVEDQNGGTSGYVDWVLQMHRQVQQSA